MAALPGERAKIVVDLSIPTDRQLSKRRPDLVLHFKDEHRVVILQGAVAWDPLLADRERQKTAKYGELAAYLTLNIQPSREPRIASPLPVWLPHVE